MYFKCFIMPNDFFNNNDLGVVTPLDMAALWSAFHDGSLMWTAEGCLSGQWTLYCPYLAELVAPTRTCFYLQVKGVRAAVFQPWWREADRAAVSWDLLEAPRRWNWKSQLRSDWAKMWSFMAIAWPMTTVGGPCTWSWTNCNGTIPCSV